jgi:hypothetical protein
LLKKNNKCKEVTDRSRGKKEKEAPSPSTAVSLRTATGNLSPPELSLPRQNSGHRTGLLSATDKFLSLSRVIDYYEGRRWKLEQDGRWREKYVLLLLSCVCSSFLPSPLL